jgi:aspartyl-tRNA(Asn)/glutamyl-tRNA(Gln) amidotransferase subunit A
MSSPRGLPDSLAGLARAFSERRLSPVEVAGALLERIEADRTNSFVTVTAEQALHAAARAERRLLSGAECGPLCGVPVGIKDIIYTGGVRTTMGSAFFEDYAPNRSAKVVRQLEGAGAIILGKTSTHEFAYGPTGDRSHFGPVRNPHDHARISGGSSAGSAAAVASGLVYGALGTDTGGSVRIPAALCGIVGMKPTFGRVGKSGVFPLSWTLDHVGTLARTVEDNALLLGALAGHDPDDPYSVDRPAEDFARYLERGVRGGVVGVPPGFYFEYIEPDVREMVTGAIEVFRGIGARVREVEIPDLDEILRAQRLILAAEAYAVHEERLKESPELFGEEVRERLIAGEPLRAHRYAAAQQTRRRSRESFLRALSEVEVLLVPTAPITAPEIRQREVEIGGRKEHVFSALTRLTGPTNLNGLPGLSVPCGTNASGLPAGLQLIGRPFDEATLYRYGNAYERAVSD